MTMENLTPELREKLSKFLEVERWHRALHNSYATKRDHISRLCWEAALSEVPLNTEERKIYKQLNATARSKVQTVSQ